MRFRPLFLLLPAITHAEPSTPTDLGEMLVEALKPHLRSATDVGEASGFARRDLAEALAILPGVSLTRTGNRAESMVTVRGFDLKQVPVFVDGIPVYVPYDGYADLGRFTVPQDGEIEVAKGLSPVLAGPNALGGLINIHSRRPQERLEGSLHAGMFSGGGTEAGLAARGREEKFYWQFDLSYLEQDHFPLSGDFKAVPRENGGSRDNSHREDWRTSGRVAWTPSHGDEYVFGFWIQRGEKENPTYVGSDPTIRARFWQWPAWDKDTFYTLTRTSFGTDTVLETKLHYDRFRNTLKAYDNANYNSQAMGSSFTSWYDDWTAGGAFTVTNTSFENLRLAAAVHFQRDHHEQQDRGFPKYTFEDETASVGVEAEYDFRQGTRITAGVSHDWRKIREAVDTNTGTDLGGDDTDAWNPQFVIRHDFTEKLSGHLGIAEKSRFATIKDRYSYRMGQAIPNPDLEPETALHVDLGLDGSAFDDRFQWSGGLFFSRIDDAIQRVDNVAFTGGGAGLFQLQNVGEVEHKGIELATGMNWTDHLETGLRYAWIHAENRSNPAIRVFGTPEHEILLFARIQPHEKVRIIPSYTWADDRIVTSTGKEVGHYARLDLKMEIDLPARTTLGFGVTNLLDRNQELDEGFPEEGRNYFINLRHDF